MGEFQGRACDKGLGDGFFGDRVRPSVAMLLLVGSRGGIYFFRDFFFNCNCVFFDCCSYHFW